MRAIANDPERLHATYLLADGDNDGIVNGKDAVHFFGASGLPKKVLSQIWLACREEEQGTIRDLVAFRKALLMLVSAKEQVHASPNTL